jgi:hypothetical protein
VQEAVEIAEAVEGMLDRIGKEQQRTKAALESARDFAAVASQASSTSVMGPSLRCLLVRRARSRARCPVST